MCVTEKQFGPSIASIPKSYNEWTKKKAKTKEKRKKETNDGPKKESRIQKKNRETKLMQVTQIFQVFSLLLSLLLLLLLNKKRTFRQMMIMIIIRVSSFFLYNDSQHTHTQCRWSSWSRNKKKENFVLNRLLLFFVTVNITKIECFILLFLMMMMMIMVANILENCVCVCHLLLFKSYFHFEINWFFKRKTFLGNFFNKFFFLTHKLITVCNKQWKLIIHVKK